jgi:hypothetical protein
MLTLWGQPESPKVMMMLVSLAYERFPNDPLFSSFFMFSLSEETLILLK